MNSCLLGALKCCPLSGEERAALGLKNVLCSGCRAFFPGLPENQPKPDDSDAD